jgi:hypothetical protein
MTEPDPAGFFPAGRDRGVTVAVEGFFAFAWFGWGHGVCLLAFGLAALTVSRRRA